MAVLGTLAVIWDAKLDWNFGKLQFLGQQSQQKYATALKVTELMSDSKNKRKKFQTSSKMLICKRVNAFNEILNS